MSSLQVNNISKSYQLDNKELNVLNDISISLDSGDFLTILGPSGCGKSTLIRCICGMETPDSGEILIDGKPIDGIGPERLMVFQDFNQLFPWKTVEENIVFPLKLNNVSNNKVELNEIAEEFMDIVNLKQFRNAYPNQLSGGMRQRVAIARSLALNPKVLLMDEPFGALDAQTRAILQKELYQLWEKFKTTIIFITHNVQEAIILGSKIIVLGLMPATVKFETTNTIPYPRMPETKEFMSLWKELYGHLETKRF
ncbi:MAG: ABC transporter ATP-binding protein [Candidatus Neomarinimicrobiota bacterium]